MVIMEKIVNTIYISLKSILDIYDINTNKLSKELILTSNPDVVVITGDMVSNYSYDGSDDFY